MGPITRAVAIGGLLAGAASSLAGGIKWNTDLATALKISKRTHRPVMVDFYGES